MKRGTAVLGYRPFVDPPSAPFTPPAKVSADPTTARIVERIQKLVRVPSQGGIDDPVAICRVVQAELARAGLSSSLLTDPEGRPVGVVSEIAGARPGPTWVLDAVVDTAPVGDPSRWKTGPFGAEIRGSRIYGRGTADSKAAAAIFIELGRELLPRANEIAGRVVLFFDAAEHTGRFEGVQALLERYPHPDGVLIGYPGSETVKIGSRGFYRAKMRFGLGDALGDPAAIAAAIRSPTVEPLPVDRPADFPLPPKLSLTAIESTSGEPAILGAHGALVATVVVAGDAAHSGWSGQHGTNAIDKTAAILDRLSGLGARVVSIQGGRYFSQIPDRIELVVALPLEGDDDARVAGALAGAVAAVDGELPARVKSRIEDPRRETGPIPLVASLDTNVDVRTTLLFDANQGRAHLARASARSRAEHRLVVSIDELESHPAFVLPPSNRMRRALESSARRHAGKPLPSVVTGPANVGNLLAELGIPATTGFGVPGRRVHGTDESIETGPIPFVLATYRDTIGTLVEPKPEDRPEGARIAP